MSDLDKLIASFSTKDRVLRDPEDPLFLVVGLFRHATKEATAQLSKLVTDGGPRQHKLGSGRRSRLLRLAPVISPHPPRQPPPHAGRKGIRRAVRAAYIAVVAVRALVAGIIGVAGVFLR